MCFRLILQSFHPHNLLNCVRMPCLDHFLFISVGLWMQVQFSQKVHIKKGMIWLLAHQREAATWTKQHCRHSSRFRGDKITGDGFKPVMVLCHSALFISTWLFRHLLVVFGGLQGLEASVDTDQNLDVTDPSVLFDLYLNTCPGQGSRTIRTEVRAKIFVEPSMLRQDKFTFCTI